MRVARVIVIFGCVAVPALAQKTLIPGPSERLGMHPRPRREQPAAQLRSDEERCLAATEHGTSIDPFAAPRQPEDSREHRTRLQRTELFKKAYAACLTERGYEVK